MSDNPRGIDLTDIEDGDFLRYDEASTDFVAQAPGAAVSVPAAITGGEAPTEAEHNALRAAVADLVTKLTAFGALAAP